MKNAIILTVLAAVLIFSGWKCYVTLFPPAPHRTGVAAARAQAQTEASAGAQFLVGLLEAGQLPGVTTNDHGRLSARAVKVTYPYAVTFQLNKTGDPSKYNYTIQQRKKGADWQLTRAWQTDSNGVTLQEWPVK